jgi:hypothetical protein
LNRYTLTTQTFFEHHECVVLKTASPLSREYPQFKSGISVTTRLRDFIPN